MIKALVNNSWKLFDIDELQPGTSVFNFKTGLYETMRTRDHRPVLLPPHLDRLTKTKELEYYWFRVK